MLGFTVQTGLFSWYVPVASLFLQLSDTSSAHQDKNYGGSRLSKIHSSVLVKTSRVLGELHVNKRARLTDPQPPRTTHSVL